MAASGSKQSWTHLSRNAQCAAPSNGIVTLNASEIHCRGADSSCPPPTAGNAADRLGLIAAPRQMVCIRRPALDYRHDAASGGGLGPRTRER